MPDFKIDLKQDPQWRYEYRVRLLITHNGFQWSGFTVTEDELNQVEQTIKEFKANRRYEELKKED